MATVLTNTYCEVCLHKNVCKIKANIDSDITQNNDFNEENASNLQKITATTYVCSFRLTSN